MISLMFLANSLFEEFFPFNGERTIFLCFWKIRGELNDADIFGDFNVLRGVKICLGDVGLLIFDISDLCRKTLQIL